MLYNGIKYFCLKISTRCKAIFINTYFDLNSYLNEFRKNIPF